MAKWGEGDPRWIVEERPDATNVNNWHWTEKNASPWSKDKLKELLNNLKIDDKIGYCQITDMSRCEGEAVANNRKAKLIFFYEWNIELKWEGFVSGSDKKLEGTISIPNLSEENEPEEVTVNVSLSSPSPEGDLLKEMLRHKGADIIRGKLAEYITSLKKEFSQGMILPSKNSDQNNITPSFKPQSKAPKIPGTLVHPQSSQSNPKGFPLQMGKLTMSESFKCTAEEFYNALTIKEMVQAFTQNPCILEATAGGRFELFNGNVSGTFIELVPHSKIVQKWRYKPWPQGHYSTVEISIEQKESSTDVLLSQTGVPKDEIEKTKEGWKRFYWDSMRRTFGFGVPLI